MKFKWTDNGKELRYDNEPVLKIEKDDWCDKINNFFWWILIASCLSPLIWLCVRSYNLYLIKTIIKGG